MTPLLLVWLTLSGAARADDPSAGWVQTPQAAVQPTAPPAAARDEDEHPLAFAGVTLVSTTGHVDFLDPRKPEFKDVVSIPFLIGEGVQIRTGVLSHAILSVEDGALLSLASHGLVSLGEAGCELREGWLQVAGPPHWVATIRTAAVPARVLGRNFSIETAGKGKGESGKLGHGRAAVGKLVAVHGFVNAQLPMGNVRAKDLPITLHEGTVVDTEANSYALIVFPDGSRVKLRADSAGSIDSPRRFTVAAGAVDVQVSEKGKLEVRTIERAARIRGEAFTVEMNPDHEKTEERPDLPSTPSQAAIPGSAGWDSSGGR